MRRVTPRGPTASHRPLCREATLARSLEQVGHLLGRRRANLSVGADDVALALVARAAADRLPADFLPRLLDRRNVARLK